MSGFITLTIHSARKLVSVDSSGFCNPFVTVTIAKKKQKSSIKHKTLEPVWDEIFQGALSDLPSTFELIVRDAPENSLKKPVFLGRATFTITGKEITVAPFWLKLEDKQKYGLSNWNSNSNKNRDLGEIRIAYVVTWNKETMQSLIANPNQTLQKLHKNPSISNSSIPTSQPPKKESVVSIFKIMQQRKPLALREFLKNAKAKEVNIVDGDGQSPLHIACLDYAKKIPEYISILLDFEGIDVNIRNNSSNTPLHYFCQMWPDHRTCETLLSKIVIDRKADVNAKNGNGETPLFKAIGNSAVRGILMKFLFTHGADPHIITETSGQSLLHWAAREGRVDLLELILDYSTDVDIKDKFNKTPLDMVEQWRTSFENRRENYDIIQSKLIRVKELYKFLDENDLGELKFSLRTDEYYLDVLCEIGQEEILKFTQFKVGTRHKLASAVKQYKSNTNTVQQPTKNKIHRADDKMDNFLKELKSGNESFLVVDPSQIEYQEMLGKGGAGTVWKGVLTHDSQALPCAIKELNYDSIHADQLDEFKAEFEILNNIRHCNVVRLIGLTVLPRLGMVMELCTHGSMVDVLKRKDFDFGWDRFFAMLTDTINGIDRLHSNIPQLLHRDLKTLNLLVTKNGNTTGNQLSVRVADFGLASKNTHSKSDALKEMQGTPFYMPPEMTTGSKYSNYSDIYSLAIIIWEMSYRVINGQYSVPYAEFEEFSGSVGAFTLMLRVSSGNLRPTIPDKMPIELMKIIEKAWDSDPTARYDIKTIGVAIADLHKIYLENKPLWEQCEIVRIPGTAPEKSSVSTSNSESEKTETPPSPFMKATSKKIKEEKEKEKSKRENSKDRDHTEHKSSDQEHNLKPTKQKTDRPRSGREHGVDSNNNDKTDKKEHRQKTSIQDKDAPKKKPTNSDKTEKTHK